MLMNLQDRSLEVFSLFNPALEWVNYLLLHNYMDSFERLLIFQLKDIYFLLQFYLQIAGLELYHPWM